MLDKSKHYQHSQAGASQNGLGEDQQSFNFD